MTENDNNDSCKTVQACYSVYPIPVAAALWCKVPADQVEEELQKAVAVDQSSMGQAIFRHPYLQCLEPRIRAIHAAIDAGTLQSCREDGKRTEEHVSPKRRHVYGLDLKEWAKSISPSERPEFLFDEIERTTHSSINVDSFQTLQADRDALKQRLNNGHELFKELEQEKKLIEKELNTLKKKAGKDSPLNIRAETTYQCIIAALLSVISGGLPGVEKHPSFPSEAKLIEAIDQHYKGYSGLSKSNLTRKFPESKQTLDSQ